MGGETSVGVFFKYGTDSTLTMHAVVNAGTLSSVGVFDAPVSGLTTGITYYFQACVTTGTGEEICDGILSFVVFLAPCPEASVVTTSATDVTATGAILHGAVTNIGMGPSVGVFFKYGTDSTLGTYTRAEAGRLSSVGVFSAPLSGLTAGTTYYFQACATTGTGDVCGTILSFVAFLMPCPAVSVVTSPATNVAATGATLNGAITDLGLQPNVGVFFKYGTESHLGTYTRAEAGRLSSVGVFSAPLSGLTTETTYYFQACATTGTGDVCGATLSFVAFLTPCPT